MQNHLTKHLRCILCGSAHITPYLSLGKMAPANSFVSFKDISKPEKKYPLGLLYCHKCHSSQLTHTIAPATLFAHYAYYSSTSPLLVSHFIDYAHTLKRKFPKLMKQLVVDIGSNDGVLLKPLQKIGAHILGVDPARECSNVAVQSGIPTIQKYFTPALAKQIQKKYGNASIITANNVIAHTPFIHDFIRGIRTLLQSDGVFVFEVKYMGDILEHNEFDIIYHEHVFSYLLHPLYVLLDKHELKIIDVQHMQIHGGSLRVYASHKRAHVTVQPSVQEMLTQEKNKGYLRFSTYRSFAQNPPRIKKKLQTLLRALVKKGNRIAGYGASAKGTTMLQYCELYTDTIAYIVDNASSKIGTYTPATHIPIVDPKELKIHKPDYILLLAWDHKNTIMKKEQWYTQSGGIYIVPVPTPALIKQPSETA
ncbi:class I SAM-dependent methyltransferase [Candidatus Woesebacteria bacterium]|nr:class I SAM-dependent methyltransferase [Candidatus Woesebacteria bacterium]